ncbi:hypothetical protein KA005_03135, partial [bacterium]|nr:hypothetical protein [bacterium]
DYTFYKSKYKDSNIDALLWLQKVFIVSRFFESQSRCETGIPKNEKRLRVGDMTSSNGDKFEAILSLSHLMKHHDKTSTFNFNPKLDSMIISLIISGEHYRALRLICDSPKHGVLSSVLNLMAKYWDKQIYSIGFHALAEVIDVFVKGYRQENSLPGK